MRIIARSTLKRFVDSLADSADYRAVKSSVESWFHEVAAAKWKAPADVVRVYANASIIGSDRVVFNIKSNSYRLIVAINYAHQIVFVKWIGSHSAYDRIDASTVKYGNQSD